MKRTITPKLVLLVLLVAMSAKLHAQARLFSFSSSSGTYTPLATASSGSTTYASLIAAAQNDAVTGVQSIGFSLNYLGTVYTQYSVNSNGLLKLGSTAVTNESANSFASVTNVPKLFGWWDNIATGTSASAGGVIRNLTGTAPNRILKIQWNCNHSNLTTGATDLSWQVWIYETSNKIEYRYGNGTTTGNTASLGAAGVTATDFTSITASGSPTASTTSSNDANATWPGNGAVYTMAPPAPLTGAKTVYGTASATQFVSMREAVNTLNWVGAGTGGVTFTVAGGNTETVPNGVGTIIPAGLLISKGGTVANPIVFQWDGLSTKPVLQAGVGIGNFDYVLGIAGQDYITIDGIAINENTVANTTNARRAEMGIALFKERYNTTLGNNGSQHVTIKNCAITLTRFPNSYANYGYTHYPYLSMGISASQFTSTHAGSTNSYYWTYSNPNQGILSAKDVNSYNTFIGNTIDNCSYGISLEDGFTYFGATGVYAGTGNVIGQSGAGNTITNWGPLNGVNYFGGGYNFTIAGIVAGGQQDIDIQYNTVDGCYSESAVGSSYIKMVSGIWAGMGTGGWAVPRVASSIFKINNNTVTNIDFSKTSTNAAITANTKSIFGITFAANDDGGQRAKGGGNVEIKNNTITNLKGIGGNVIAINSNFTEGVYTTLNGGYRAGFQSGGDVSISGNTINNISRTGSNLNALLSAVYWKHGSKNLYINDNKISAFTLGSTTLTPTASTAGMQLIYNYSVFSEALRTLVQVNGNKIENCNILAPATATVPVAFSGILIENGGVTNNITNDTITNCSVYNGGQSNSVYNTDLIRVVGRPKGGVSTVTVDRCRLVNNTRTGWRAGANVGYLCKFRGIVVDYTGANQTKNISNNYIDGLYQTATGTFNQESSAYLRGIYTEGRTTVGNVTNIFNDTVINIGGPVGNYRQVISSNVSTVNQYSLTGIVAQNWNVLNIYNNNVAGLDAGSLSTGTPLDGNYSSGPSGIVAYNTTASYNTTANIYSNFISGLTAPAMRSRLAINGLVVSGLAAKYNVYHNTIVLGAADGGTTGRLTSTTTGTFGVTGLLNATYYYNDKRFTVDYRNNLISVNATAKLTAANMDVRDLNVSTVKKRPLGIAKTTTGNVYFINPDVRNFNYGQATIYNTTGGIRNCYFYSPAPTPVGTTNATYNLVNDNVSGADFNTQCGFYKTFMAGAEKQSYVELTPANAPTPPPFVNTPTGAVNAPNALKLTTGATSAAFNADPITTPVNINSDYFANARSGSKVAAGAHETTGVLPAFINGTINFEFAGLNDSLCGGDRPIVVTITPPAGKAIATGTTAPRMYYRRIESNGLFNTANVDANVLPANTGAANTAAGVSGWRFVNPTSNIGSDYTFNFNLSLLSTAATTGAQYGIEYFFIAQTSDNNVCSWSSGDWSANTYSCPTTVRLETLSPIPVPADLTTGSLAALDDNSIQDNYFIYSGSDLTKGIYLANGDVSANVTAATAPASAGATVSVGTNDYVSVTARNNQVTATGEFIQGVTYRFEVATASTFGATIVQTTDQMDSVFNYPMPSAAATRYFRASLLCGSSVLANTITPYYTVSAIEVPLNTSTTPDQSSCAGTAVNLPLSSTATPTNLARYYWVVDPAGAVKNIAPTSSTLGAINLSVTPVADSPQRGMWASYVTSTIALPIVNQGAKTAAYTIDELSPDATLYKGIAFHTNEMIKLNSVGLPDPTDAAGTSGYNISIYAKDGITRLYTTAASATGDGATVTQSFTNWYLAPGDYMMIMDTLADGTFPASGGLATTPLEYPLSIPNTPSPYIQVLGGVEGLDFSAQTTDYNYFFNINASVFPTSQTDSFFWNVRQATCCSATPVVGLINTGSVSGELSTSRCTENSGWFYYYDPLVSGKLIAAVNPNGNVWNPTSLVIDNSGAVGDAIHLSTDGVDTTELMPYMFSIQNGDDLTLNGGVKLRFYFPLADYNSVNSRPSYTQKSWFKYEGIQSDVVGAVTPLGLTDGIKLTPSSTGTENGISYVQFDDVTSFSTFGYGAGTSALVVAPLPLTILSFNATIANQSTLLKWETSNEQQIAHFDVEKSADGYRFMNMEQVSAKNADYVNEYATVDRNPNIGTNYYRLKIVEVNGTVSYSPTRMVRFNTQNDVTLYPNPAKASISIKSNTEVKSIAIYNTVGQRVSSSYINAKLADIDLSTLQQGSFYMQITLTNGEVMTRSFTKL